MFFTDDEENALEKKDLRNQDSKNNTKARSIKDAKLFDLDKADELYEQYLKQFNKEIPTSDSIRTIRFYRFVKTLAEINRNNIEGKPLRTLDDQADVVQKPNEYLY